MFTLLIRVAYREDGLNSVIETAVARPAAGRRSTKLRSDHRFRGR